MGEACPRVEDLQLLLVGRLDETALSRIESHLSSCAQCEALLDGMSRAPSALSEQLKGRADPTSAMGLGETQVQRAIRRVRDLFRDATGAAESAEIEGAENLPKIPGYQVIEVVAKGGMGVVLKARQDVLDRLVAIKLPLSGAVGTAEERERFIREARSSARLRHPNICQIHEVGRVGNRPFISMSFIEGPTLRGWVQQNQPNARQIALTVGAVARAVAFAHGHGVIHRDIKPSNILVENESGQPILTDFGLAKELGHAEIEVTQTGQIMGTPAYMAPEQAAGQTDQVGTATDVYSLGALLYDLLTGQAPFKGATGEVLRKVQSEAPVTPRKLVPRLHKDLETIVLKAMSKRIQERYGSALALAEDLDRFAAGEPIMARRQPVGLRAARFVRRHRVPFFVAAVLGIVSGIVIQQIWSKARISGLREQVRTAMDVSDLWEPERLTRLDIALAKLEARAPHWSSDLRRQANDRLVAQLQDELSDPDLSDAAMERIAERVEQLPARGVGDLTPLRKLMTERKKRWERVAQLEAPYENLSEFFTWQFHPAKVGLASKGYGKEGVWDLSTQIACPTNAMMTARFVLAPDAQSETGAVAGLLLSHEKNRSAYRMTVCLPPSLMGKLDRSVAGASISDPATTPTTAPVGSAVLERMAAGGRVQLTLWRGGRQVAQRDFAASRFKVGAPIEVQFKRDGDMLTAQVNDLPPLTAFDAYPEGGQGRVYGVVSSEPARLLHLAMYRRSGANVPNLLERGDELFAARRLSEAREAYRGVVLSNADESVRQAGRYKEALCLLELQQEDEAAVLLETVSTANGDRWPNLALLRLWVLRLSQRRLAEADAMFETLRLRTTGEQLRMLVPTLPPSAVDTIKKTCKLVTEGANMGTLDRESLNRFERAIFIFDTLGDSEGSQAMRYFQIKARHQIGDLDKSAALAEQFLNDQDNDSVDKIIHVIEEYGWVQSLRGDVASADLQLRRRLENPGGGWNDDYLPLLVERARLCAVSGDWTGARASVDAYIARHQGTRYRWLGTAWLIKGFIAEQNGQHNEALLAWHQGARKPSPRRGVEGRVQGLDAPADGPDEPLSPAELQYACIMTSLCGAMTDEWAAWYLQRFVTVQDIDEHPGAQNPLAVLKSSISAFDGVVARDCWLSDRGRDIARQMTFHLMSRADRTAAMPALLAFEVARRSSPTQPLSAAQDAVYWQTARDIYDHFVRFRKGTGMQPIAFALSWRGVLGPLGWQGVAPSLSPDLRARFAYILARKSIGQHREDNARNLLREARELAGKDVPLATLIDEELKRLSKGGH